MKRLLLALALALCYSAHGQPFLRQSFTTNNPAQFPPLLPSPSTSSNWFVVIHTDGDGAIYESPKFAGINTNLNWNGRFGANSGAFTNALTLNGSPVLTNAPAVTAVNNLTVTQYVRMPWTTLTMSGSNVSSIDFATASMFKLTLTNNGFFGAPSNLPGTNVAQMIQVHVAQDGAGTRTLTLTNSSWAMSGSGTSTNQVVTLNTNANAVTVLTFATSPFSATLVNGVAATIGQ